MTIQEQLEKLPEPYNRLALMRADESKMRDLCNSKADAVFVGLDSYKIKYKEGFAWWQQVFIAIYDHRRIEDWPAIAKKSMLDLAEWESRGCKSSNPTPDEMLDWLDRQGMVVLSRTVPHEQTTIVQTHGGSRMLKWHCLRSSIKELMRQESEVSQ